MYIAEDKKKNAVRADTDSELINDITRHYLKGRSKDYRDLAASRTRLYLNDRIDADTAPKCSIDLKKRQYYDMFTTLKGILKRYPMNYLVAIECVRRGRRILRLTVHDHIKAPDGCNISHLYRDIKKIARHAFGTVQ